MQKKVASDSLFTQQVKNLLTKVHSKSVVNDSVYERAITFYHDVPHVEQQRKVYKKELLSLEEKFANSAEKDKKLLEKLIKKRRQEQKFYQAELTDQRLERHKHIIALCHDIIELSEGDNFNETNRKSAKLLGTIQLITPTEGKFVATFNERYKPLYKAVLALRLLDRLCMDDTIPSYIKDYLPDVPPEQYASLAEIDAELYQHFVEFVKVPLVCAALVQDIGNYHPEAQAILLGTDGNDDPYRTLDLEDRKRLLQVNYRETINYLADGLGTDKYVGNSKAERDSFNQNEKKKILFIKELLKSSINPKESLGNLLKVPQIYTSIILSTKASYNYKLLPKVYQALYQNASRGNCSQAAVTALQKITGDYPQGYGITFIPLDSDGKKYDRYEYAIVNQLYPEKADEPICRVATRNLTFINQGPDIKVTQEVNLYIGETAQRFARISKKRLNEILELLASNYLERKKLDLVPRCWHAGDYFSMKANQRLWNKVDN